MSNLQSLAVIGLTIAAIFVPQFLAIYLTETRNAETA